MSSISHAERLELADKVYIDDKDKKLKEPPAGYTIDGKQELNSGLEIYALKKTGTNEVVFTVRGSDDNLDWKFDGPNASHFRGKLHLHDEQAIRFVDQYIATAKSKKEIFNYSFAGDSKGGAIAQLLSWTFGFTGTASEPAACSAILKDPAYLELVATQLQTRNEPAGIVPGKFVNIFEIGSPVYNLSALLPGNGYVGVNLFFDLVDADFSETLAHAIVSQHTEREIRIQILKSLKHPDGIDPVFVLTNMMISRYAEKIEALREEIMNNREDCAVLDESCATSQKDAQLLKLESAMLKMIASRDEMISGAYGDDTGFVDQWAKDALKNAVVDPALLDTSFFLPQQFQLPNDPDVYFVYASGRIVKAPALAGVGEKGTTLVLNEADQPQSSEELIEQLQEIGLSSEEAQALVDTSGFAQICSARQHAAEQLQEVHDFQVYLGEQLRVADMGVLQAQESLVAAVQADDLAGIVQAVFGYYAAAEQRAQLTGYGDAAALDETFREVFDTIGNALAFGQAVDTQDGWSMVREGAGLLQRIDHYLAENELGSLFRPEGSSALSWGTSGLELLQALEQGNGWGIAQSSVGLAASIDNYFTAAAVEDAARVTPPNGSQIDTTATALQGVGSVIGLAMNLARLDDVLDSGDAGAIATTAASTAHYAVNTYNSISTLANGSTAGTVSTPGLSYVGYAGAALQLSEGDTRGAVTSAASTYLMSCPPYGWIFALALQLANMLTSDPELPEATAWFGLGEDGTLFVQVDGDSEMQEMAGGHGWSLVPVLEDYRAAGGRLMIDGRLPRLTVVGGDSSRITYDDAHGGKIEVRLDDLSDLGDRMLGVLYARDRGERLDSAVQQARGDFGEIDMAKVDALMAGYGFTKRGMTYVTGETTSRQGTSVGSGVFHGGGNQGPQGRLFTARPGDVRSLPVPPEQLPSQKMGEVARVAGLNTMFRGSGAELLAMALILPGGLLGLSADEADAASASRPDSAATGPLTAAELDAYRRWLEAHAGGEHREESGHLSEHGQTMVSPLASPDLHSFIATHWPDHPYLQSLPDGLSADTVYYFRENFLFHGWQQTGSPAAWWQRWRAADLLDIQLHQPETAAPPPEFFTARQEVFSGGRVDSTAAAGEEPAATAEEQPNPEIPDSGPSFLMAQDTVLRFLPAELLEDTGSTASAIVADAGSLVALGQAENGRVWQDENGDIRFAPAPGFVGSASFAYTVQMPDGTTLQQEASIVVENVNDEPQLSDDRFILREGETLALERLLANDTDPDGDPLVIDHLRGLVHGEVAVLGGILSFVPEAGFVGDIEFSYWVRDHIDSYPVMATINLTYLDVNTGPVAGDDRFLIMEDASLVTSVDALLANDRELDGEEISFAGLGTAIHGTVTREADGTIVFTPDDDYAGTDAGFSYLVEDQSGNRSSGWAAVEVVDRREPPVVTATTRPPINEDEPLVFSPDEVATFISDADGDNVHLESITNVVGGSIVTTDGYYTFVPEPDYAGPASFDYRASDNHRGTVDGHLAFTIAAVNDPIDTGHDELATMEDQAVVTSSGELLADDTDVDGDVFSFRSVGDPRHGAVEQAPDGTITFTPATDYCGDEAGFHYRVADSEEAVSTGWVSISIEPINDRPRLIADSLTIREDQPLVFDGQTLARFVTDVDGDPLTVIGCRALSGGTITETDGLFAFVPTADYHGAGSLQVTVADPAGETVETELSLTIEAVDDPTQFASHRLATDEEQPVAITTAELLAGATDKDGPLSLSALGDTAHGSVSLTDDGLIIFTPEHNYYGHDAGFGYLVVDGDGNEAMGRVSVAVANNNDVPQVIGDQLDGTEDQPIALTAETLAAFLFDPDGDALHLAALSASGAGQVFENDGLFTIVPDPNYHGSIELIYQAADGQGGELYGELQLNLAAVDDPTNFGDDRFRTQEEQPLTTSVAALMANDEDADGPLSFVGLGEARAGQMRLDSDGGIEFLPETDYYGDQAGFSYTVRDTDGNEATGWVAVQVDNVNDEPLIIGDRLFLPEDQPLVFSPDEIARFLIDPDGQDMNLIAIDQVVGGRAERDNDTWRFVPDEHWYGEASLSYLAANDTGETIAGTLAVGVLPVNDLPAVAGASAAGVEDHPVTIALADLLAGATDIEDGSDLRFGGFVDSSHGDARLDDSGLVHFLPDDDYFGSAAFRYRAVDSEGGVGIGEVQLAIVGVNDAPVAVDDDGLAAWSNDGYENVYLAVTLLANDYDVDFDPLAITALGAARFGDVTLAADGTIRYVAPSPDWVGIDSFTYRIADSSGAAAEATATLAVKVNTSPDVYPELLFINEDEMVVLGPDELLANDSDIDGDELTIIGAEAGEHCTVDLRPDGTVLFRPELNYNDNYPGQAWFTYTVADGISEPVSTAAFFAIEPVNDRPILTSERISGAVEDNAFQFNIADLLANDSDVEMASFYEQDAIFFAGLGAADHGAISCDPDSGMVFYQPDADFFGTETFSYSVIDSYGALSTIASYIEVAGVNDLPVIQEDIGSPAEEYIWNYYSTAGLVSNDFDVDGDRLTIHSPRVVQGNAQVTLSGGNLAVKPAIGTDRVVIDYTVSDGNGGEVRSKLTIPQILEHNFAPQFTNRYEVLLYANIFGNAPLTDFSFQVTDRNGGDNWGQLGDIASISAGRLRTNYPLAGLTELNNAGDFRFRYNARDLDETIDYYATFTITAVDHAGATGTILVDYDKLATRKGVYTYQYNPVVLDLDGDGVELLAIGDQPVFDWCAGGLAERSGWVGLDDGFLVFDHDRDRQVTRADEISLVGYNPEATTDLQGLRAFDTNENGLFDTQDEQWSFFGIWQDKNSDGSTDTDEFRSLDEHGIASIDLQSDETYQELANNHVYGTTTCHLTDGSTLTTADVGLSGGEVSVDLPVEPDIEEPGSRLQDSPVETLPLQEQEGEPTIKEESERGAEEEPERSVDEAPELLGDEGDGGDEVDGGDGGDEADEESERAVVPASADAADQLETAETANRTEGSHPAEGAEEQPLTDADLNRLAAQLVADIASCAGDETDIGQFVPLEDSLALEADVSTQLDMEELAA